jgi:hypothetical protein
VNLVDFVILTETFPFVVNPPLAVVAATPTPFISLFKSLPVMLCKERGVEAVMSLPVEISFAEIEQEVFGFCISQLRFTFAPACTYADETLKLMKCEYGGTKAFIIFIIFPVAAQTNLY